MKITAENSTSPATKAPSASKRRAVRGVIDDSRLAETGDQPGADHLEKNGGAVMRPQRHGAGQHETQRPCRDHDSGAAWRNSIRDREVFRHSHHIRPIRVIGNLVMRSSCWGMILSEKPVPTFRDHALTQS